MLRTNIAFKVFRSQQGCQSYVIGSSKSKTAIVIDPRLEDLEIVTQWISLHGLVPRFVIDTHTHADHYSCSHLFKKDFGAIVVMGAQTKSERVLVRISGNQVIHKDDEFVVSAHETPGHTPDSICVAIEILQNKQKLLFTGDTLLIGGSGRVDFPGASASLLFDSLTHLKKTTDSETLIFPGHDYSGVIASRADLEFQELNCNKNEFIRKKETELCESMGIISDVLVYNNSLSPEAEPRCIPEMACASGIVLKQSIFTAVSPNECSEKLSTSDTGDLFLDIREPDEFSKVRIEGMQNLPMAEVLLNSKLLSSSSNVYLFCQRGNRSSLLASTLTQMGFTNLIDVKGGLIAWIGKSLPVKKG